VADVAESPQLRRRTAAEQEYVGVVLSNSLCRARNGETILQPRVSPCETCRLRLAIHDAQVAKPGGDQVLAERPVACAEFDGSRRARPMVCCKMLRHQVALV
jgi:hypothetical protein